MPVPLIRALVRIQSNGAVERVNGHKDSAATTRPTSPPVMEERNRHHQPYQSTANGHKPNETATSMSGRSSSRASCATPVSAHSASSRCATPVKSYRSTTPAPVANGVDTTARNTVIVDRNSSATTGDPMAKSKTSMTTSTDNKSVIESDLNAAVNSVSKQNGHQMRASVIQKPPSPAPVAVKPDASVDQTSDSNSSTLTRRGRLTTEDLLIIIHNSKKKHNIKTEPEIIVNSPPSSRSHSSNSNSPPSAYQPVIQRTSGRSLTPSRVPQSPVSTSPPDRRSWNGSETGSPSVTQAGERRSLASDRMGPTKPTTMTDFKRLLSQTRSQTFNSDRLSAQEILRANSKRPLTPVIKCITSFVGGGNKTRVTPSPAPTPTSLLTPNKPSRMSPAPSPGPPPQIMNGAINANTPNLVKPRIINGRTGAHHRHHHHNLPAYRMV
ncbi:unnamed protein product, partial [Oppiella nova]